MRGGLHRSWPRALSECPHELSRECLELMARTLPTLVRTRHGCRRLAGAREDGQERGRANAETHTMTKKNRDTGRPGGAQRGKSKEVPQHLARGQGPEAQENPRGASTSESVRGSYSARLPRSSLAEVHREFVHHIVEDEVDGQEERQTIGEEIDSKERKVEKSKRTKHTTCAHGEGSWNVMCARQTYNLSLEPCVCVSFNEKM